MSQHGDTSDAPKSLVVHGVVHPAVRPNSTVTEQEPTMEVSTCAHRTSVTEAQVVQAKPRLYQHKKRPTPSIAEVEALIFLQPFLNNMGCSYSYYGELLTYGNPASLRDFDDMLRFGPIYDALWSQYFVDPTKPPRDDEPEADIDADADTDSEDETGAKVDLWDDLRTLKKLLENDGVIFGVEHRRMSGGDMSPRLVRLCNAYDDLRTIWAETIQAFDPSKISEKKDKKKCGTKSLQNARTFLQDSGCFMEKEAYKILNARSVIRVTRNESEYTRPARRRSPSPVHLGWKFSDDYDEPQAVAVRQAAIAEAAKDLEKTAEFDMTAPDKVVTKVPKCPSSPVKSKELPTLSPPATLSPTAVEAPHRLRYGRSPLQVTEAVNSRGASLITSKQQMTTQSMLLREEAIANPRGTSIKSLGLDSTIINAMAAPRVEKDEVESNPTTKERLKGWVRGVFGKK